MVLWARVPGAGVGWAGGKANSTQNHQDSRTFFSLLTFRFKQWPWRMAKISDSRLPQSERMYVVDALRNFLNSKDERFSPSAKAPPALQAGTGSLNLLTARAPCCACHMFWGMFQEVRGLTGVAQNMQHAHRFVLACGMQGTAAVGT